MPYQLRHAGPSCDRALGLRPLLEVQKRGRWLAHLSVVRYEKAGRLAGEVAKLPAALRQHLGACEAALEGCFCDSRRAVPAWPPTTPT